MRFWADRGVDGFRVDVAHALAKDLSEPLRSQPLLDSNLPLDGTDPLYDREELHDIYQTWRKVFDEYDPPRMAVAETWTPTSGRTYLYARPNELGQVFDFALLKAPWDRDEYLTVIQRSLADHKAHAEFDGGQTWVLSSHDVPRHASRLALPNDIHPDAWLMSANTAPTVDPALGLRRARAATLMMLALPGSAYIYQGEELGLPEVADLPADSLQDPIWHRTNHTLKGRDGCRIPLPWTISGTSHGFGSNGTWLPSPAGSASTPSNANRPNHTPRSASIGTLCANGKPCKPPTPLSPGKTWITTTSCTTAGPTAGNASSTFPTSHSPCHPVKPSSAASRSPTEPCRPTRPPGFRPTSSLGNDPRSTAHECAQWQPRQHLDAGRPRADGVTHPSKWQ